MMMQFIFFSIINRNMTSKTDHLERTAESARNNVRISLLN